MFPAKGHLDPEAGQAQVGPVARMQDTHVSLLRLSEADDARRVSWSFWLLIFFFFLQFLRDLKRLWYNLMQKGALNFRHSTS